MRKTDDVFFTAKNICKEIILKKMLTFLLLISMER